MGVHELSRQEARRIAVRAQALDEPRPTDLLDVVRRLTMLQNDATAAVAPSADVVAWSRLGSAYSPQELLDALKGGALVELQGMIRPAEDIALYRADMARWPGDGHEKGWRRSQAEWVEANDACRRDILRRLRKQGPLSSRDIPDTCTKPWKSSGWNTDRNVVMMLAFMEVRGEIATAGRRGHDRLYDLAERIYPDDEPVAADEAERTRNELRLRALGLARAKGPECAIEPNDVGDVGEPAVIDGVRGEWRVDPEQLDRPFSGRAALLSPLDRLVFDRKRMEEIFEFDYQLEMYKPAAKRRWGYWAMPVLFGDRLVGKIDASADRKNGVLRVNAVHQDEPFTKAMSEAVDAEIADLADWLGLELTVG
ncbi:MAG TPA: crosslink repair DNA glycosylase YcaQ family protein [Jatrophihabitantaceae bacterium]|nr:crosslink repair DNA glycosylase YcaQ family protein [Jatrophihabitantaceae bacterium]